MGEIIREFIAVEPTEESSRSLFESLSKQYTPVLRSAFLEACRLLRLPPEETVHRTELGELFVAKDSSLYYYLKSGPGFEVGSFAKGPIKEGHETFMRSVLSVLSGERRLIQPAKRAITSLSQDFGLFSVNDQDRQAARLLADEPTRKYLRDIVTTGRRERTEKEKVPSNETLGELRKLDLIKEEFLIFCRQTGQQVVMVESLAAIEEASRRGFKCFACGRPFSEEKLTHFVGRTPYGRQMSAENKWLLLHCLDSLAEWISSKQFCVLADGAVTDLFFNLHSSLVMVEIKESPYLLKDAYLLTQKIKIYKPQAAFLLRLSPLSGEAARYLETPILSRGDSVEPLKQLLPRWLDKAKRMEMEEVLEKFTDLSSLALDELSLSHLFSGKLLPVQAQEPEPRPQESIQAPEKPPEVVEKQEAPPSPAPVEEPAVDSAAARSAIIEKLAAELSGDITGRESNLHVLLRDLGDLPRRWKACLLTVNGLVIASTLDKEISELLASFGGDCFSTIEKNLSPKNLGKLSTVTLASTNFSVELSRLSGFYLALVAHLETVVPSPLGASAREQVFKSIGEQLLLRKAVQSVVFLDKNGKVLSKTATEKETIPSFNPLLEIFPEASTQFEPFGQGELKAVALRASSAVFALSSAGPAYLGVSCRENQIWEDLFPSLLAHANQVAALP